MTEIKDVAIVSPKALYNVFTVTSTFWGWKVEVVMQIHIMEVMQILCI